MSSHCSGLRLEQYEDCDDVLNQAQLRDRHDSRAMRAHSPRPRGSAGCSASPAEPDLLPVPLVSGSPGRLRVVSDALETLPGGDDEHRGPLTGEISGSDESLRIFDDLARG
jgi:hypothetical protein